MFRRDQARGRVPEGAAGPVRPAALPVSLCVCVCDGGGELPVLPPVTPPVPPQAQRRPRRTPLQELQLQPGADRTSLTPLLRRLRLKVGVRGITGRAGNGEGCGVPEPAMLGRA